MNSPFDKQASDYDLFFTHTEIGKLQRKRVWSLTKSHLANKGSLSILEINCGTGEDAIYLSKLGHQVTATDISNEMISIAKEKSCKLQFNFAPVFLQSDFESIAKLNNGKKYDIVFSNFGGINCISEHELYLLKENLQKKIKPNGLCILVVMGTSCLWENIYFLLKFKRNKAFRRKNKGGIDAAIGNEYIKTWYFRPNHIKKTFGDKFNHHITRPIGLFIPPSYLQPFFKNRKKVLSVLNFLETIFGRISWFSNLADHYLISFSKKDGV
jgi:ubiquinone/menaquinone biosynthesis C-methylase UbiE